MECCKKCGGHLWKDGVRAGNQKYQCKSCGKNSTDFVPRFSEEQKQKAIQMYLNNCGVRKTALFVGCSPGTILNWIRKSSANLPEQKSANLDGDIVEMDEIWAQSDKRVAHVKKNDRI